MTSSQLEAFHGTYDWDVVRDEGLLTAKTASCGCPTKHICLAETPEIAAWFFTPGRGPVDVLRVDLTGLDVPTETFVGGEMRIHHDIEPGRLSLHNEPVIPSEEGWIDPGLTPEGQHPTCIRLTHELKRR